jgi:hypothetical protein
MLEGNGVRFNPADLRWHREYQPRLGRMMEDELNEDFDRVTIRPVCLRRADAGWKKPTGPEIRTVIELSGMSQAQAGVFLGMSPKGAGRQVRRWISQEANIPYSAWALLCDVAGLGQIWNPPADE